jgi:predicted DCC family thiol-disulfide oxidoreductase YuxK
VALHQRVPAHERPASAAARRLPGPGHAVLFYDGECGFCRWAVGLLVAWDRGAALFPVTIQEPAGDDLLAELTPEQRLESWHLITADGTRYTGGPAFEPLLALLPCGRPLSRLAGRFDERTARLYDLISEHRDRVGRVVPGRLRGWGERTLEERRRRAQAPGAQDSTSA